MPAAGSERHGGANHTTRPHPASAGNNHLLAGTSVLTPSSSTLFADDLMRPRQPHGDYSGRRCGELRLSPTTPTGMYALSAFNCTPMPCWSGDFMRS